MKSTKECDKKRRKLAIKYIYKRIYYKSLATDFSISREKRYHCRSLLNKISRNSSLVRIRNRCFLTGRGRSVYRFCKLSRIMLRSYAIQGKLNGITKSSW